MAQHDMDLANAGGAAFRADINAALAALVSNNSGAAAPTTTFAYQFWADSTTGLLKQRNAGNSAWITIGPIADLGIQSSAQILATATGTADAITATYVPAVPALTNGLTLYFRAGLANATNTPTFSPNGLAAKVIVKGAGQALFAGDIAGAGHWVEVQYDQTLDKWVLLNPANGVVASSTSKIQSISSSVAANALTVGLNPTTLDFRSSALTNGVPNTRTIGSALSLVIPSGATLGTVAAQLSRLVLIAIDNAGTVELAIINIAGGNNLDESTLISTTAISAAATAANVVYSTTARTNVPFKVVGFIDISEAAAGTWATAATTIQGAGGQALTSLSNNGSWIAPGAAINVTYYNIYGKTIEVAVVLTGNAGGAGGSLVVAGSTISQNFSQAASAAGLSLYAKVPPGASYTVVSVGSVSLTSWKELR